MIQAMAGQVKEERVGGMGGSRILSWSSRKKSSPWHPGSGSLRNEQYSLVAVMSEF